MLWATHLIDEVLPDNQVVILHQGAVLDSGTAAEVAARAGAEDIREAFTRLTRSEAAARGDQAA